MTIAKELSNKFFRFTWVGSLHRTKVKISFPDLLSTESRTWGDWGPMHEFRISPEDPILLEYNDNITRLSDTCLGIYSPMLASDRQQTPFYVELRDAEKQIKFRIYVDKDHAPCEVRIIRYDDVELMRHTLSDSLSELPEGALGHVARGQASPMSAGLGL